VNYTKRLSVANHGSDSEFCNTTLWAACIGGAWQIERYKQAIEAARLRVKAEQVNEQYRFLSDNAQGATKKFGVKSISLRADRA
jgi:arsenite methyltransferase